MIPQILPIDLEARRAANPNLILLDVREADERLISVIPGSIHIPMGEIPARFPELDPEAEIIVQCRSGARSQQVAEFLSAQGFVNVSNLATGINGYAQTVDPSIAQY